MNFKLKKSKIDWIDSMTQENERAHQSEQGRARGRGGDGNKASARELSEALRADGTFGSGSETQNTMDVLEFQNNFFWNHPNKVSQPRRSLKI